MLENLMRKEAEYSLFLLSYRNIENYCGEQICVEKTIFV